MSVNVFHMPAFLHLLPLVSWFFVLGLGLGLGLCRFHYSSREVQVLGGAARVEEAFAFI